MIPVTLYYKHLTSQNFVIGVLLVICMCSKINMKVSYSVNSKIFHVSSFTIFKET